MPTTTASTDARQRCASWRLSSPLIHFESPVRVATLPSSVIADLNSTHGRPTRACLRKAWLSSRALAASSPSATHDLDALVAQDPEAAPGGLLGGIVGGDHDAPDARLQDRLGARRRLALVAARLERHVQRRPAQVRHAAGLDRVDLGVRAAVFLVPALPQDLAVAGDHGADDRVGLDRAGAVARELDRAREVQLVGVGAARHLDPRITPARAAIRYAAPQRPPCSR